MVRDKYRIDAFIATGSMANVYAATHRNGSRVALKILHLELAHDPSMAERFRREGYFANAIGHPGVVRAIDDDLTEDGCAFLVMELLEGDTVEERRTHLGGKIPLPEALHIGDAMLDVLAAAHAHEILHRDVKPENVFVTRKNEVKLLDFGVARFNDGRTSSDMTGVGMVLGTPAFMPPEQALGRREEVDARSDIWGVGATLFTMIAGEAVHAGGDAKTRLIATARTPARAIRDVSPTVPRAVASVIDRALAFERSERWADANAMREALRWARMSVEGHDGSGGNGDSGASLTPVTRRGSEDEATLPRRGSETFEDSTAKRAAPVIDAMFGPASSLRSPRSGDDVFTSAPPVTTRDVPPSMAMSEGPEFSLRNEAVPRAPVTERIPGAPAGKSAPPSREQSRDHEHEVPTVIAQIPGSGAHPAAPPASGREVSMGDAGAIFRAALANAGHPDLADIATTLRRHDSDALPRSPRGEAAGFAGAASHGAGSADETSPEGRPRMKMQSTVPFQQPVPPGAYAPPVRSSAPPPFVHRHPQEISASYAAAPPAIGSRPHDAYLDDDESRPSVAPGPLLSTIIPRKPHRLLRFIVSISVGILAGVRRPHT